VSAEIRRLSIQIQRKLSISLAVPGCPKFFFASFEVHHMIAWPEKPKPTDEKLSLKPITPCTPSLPSNATLLLAIKRFKRIKNQGTNNTFCATVKINSGSALSRSLLSTIKKQVCVLKVFSCLLVVVRSS